MNIDIETSQLILLPRTFQIRALMLLKFFAPGSTLSSWQPKVLCSWILSLRKYKCAIHSGKRLRKCLYIINSTVNLAVNVKKTHFMIFQRSRMKPVSAQISLRNENIKQTNSIKFLGIIVDNKLNWHEHIIYIKNKVSRAIGIIYKARKYANKQTVKQMYYTFVFPYLIYCCEIWGNTSQIHLDSLIKC